jgi:hypothetical protein
VAACAERRAIEMIDGARAATLFHAGEDTIAIEMRDAAGRDFFARVGAR